MGAKNLPVVGGIIKKGGEYIDRGAEFVKDTYEAGKDWAQTTVTSFEEGLNDAADRAGEFVDGLVRGAGQTLSDAGEVVTTGLEDAADAAGSAWDDIKNGWTDLMDDARENVDSVLHPWASIADWIQSILRAVVNWLTHPFGGKE